MCDENRNEAPSTEEQNQQMIDNGMIATVNAPHNIHCLSIIGQIEGHFPSSSRPKPTKYEHLYTRRLGSNLSRYSTVEGLTGGAEHGRRRCGGRTCNRGDDSGNVEAVGFDSARRRAFDRSTAWLSAPTLAL